MKNMYIKLFLLFIVIGCNEKVDNSLSVPKEILSSAELDSLGLNIENQIDTVRTYSDGSVWLRKYYIHKGWKYISEEGVFKNDSIKVGLYRSYYPIENSNFLMKEGCFKNNIQTGTWKHFYPNGNIEGINIYDSAGKQIYTCHFSENGRFLHENKNSNKN